MSISENDKQRLAEHLFDEIGEIDDYIIASAESFRPNKQKVFIRKLSIVAIAAALSATLAADI